MRRLALLSPFVLAACGVPGPLDEDAALEVVYDQSGLPAFAGQAIIIESCGQGAFCHSRDPDELELEPDDAGYEEARELLLRDRMGAPAGLNFDLRVASTTNDANEEATARLDEHMERVFGTRANMWYQVSIGSMPPNGAARVSYLDGVRPVRIPEEDWLRYDRVADDGVTFTPLPSLLSDDAEEVEQARDILRNWLASLSVVGPPTPVVERTQDRIDGEGNVVGDTVPVCERNCVDATWPSIYERLIRPTCTGSRCHSSDVGPPERFPAASLNMFVVPNIIVVDEDENETEVIPPEAFAAVHDRLVHQAGEGGVSMGDQCGPEGLHLIEPMDPERSLLFLKVSAESSDDVCGSRMPLSGNPLTEQRLCALRAWITCGACEDPLDAACLPCVEAARASCNINPDEADEDGCIVTQPCPNRAP